MAYTDITKAFDSVSFTKLIKVLKSYRITPKLLTWITNFLTGRKQTVAVNNALSSFLSVLSGVPQGSVIGPLLFIIYMNDVIECLTSLPGQSHSSLSLFADDLKV